MRFARVFATAAGLAALLGACQAGGPLAPEFDPPPSFNVGDAGAAGDEIDAKKVKDPGKNLPAVCDNKNVIGQLPEEALKALLTNVCGIKGEEPKE